MKWVKTRQGAYRAFVGPFTLWVYSRPVETNPGAVVWLSSATWCGVTEVLYGGEHFVTEEQVKQAAEAWIRNTAAEITESLGG